MASVLVRHASAGERDDWDGDDRLRPLDEHGRRQAAELVGLLDQPEVRRIVSSPFTRCVQTIEPLAEALGLSVEVDDRLAEGAGQAAYALVQEDGIVCCTHGDVVGDLLGRSLKTGAALELRGGAVVREIP
jgi:phosphohistidine phosphatase SixA